MGYLSNGVESAGLPMHLVNAMFNARPMEVFIESGTSGGASIEIAAKHFPECHTIEILRLGRLPIDNVTFHVGNSPEILEQLITQLHDRFTLFFLDAHYSGDVPNDTGIKECPVIEEIRAISGYQNSNIIIDDARFFMGCPPYPHNPQEWPGIAEIFDELRKALPWHYVTVVDDYILAISTHFKAAIDEEWRTRFAVRYPNEEQKLKAQMRASYKEMEKRFNDLKNYLNV